MGILEIGSGEETKSDRTSDGKEQKWSCSVRMNLDIVVLIVKDRKPE
jgi:hypothetical protein